MVPRALGPEAYGNLGFLTNFFNRTIKFLSFGVPAAYFIKLSKRQDEKKLIGFYIYFSIIMILLVFTSILGIIMLGLQESIWPEQKGIFIFAAAMFAVLKYTSQFFRQTNDAFAYTFRYEKIIILQSIFATGLVALLYFTNTLTLKSFFLMQYFLLLFVIIAGWRILRNNKIFLSKQLILIKKEIVGFIKEFYHFSHPIFVTGLVAFFVVITDRWLIQNFYGSAEQGYYTIAIKISSIVFLFTSAITSILTREMSLSYKDSNKEKLRNLFRKHVPLFYFIATYFAVFISLHAETVISIIGGGEYKNASMVIMVMAFYPAHQTYGQLGGAVFLATDQTKALRNVRVCTGLIGLIISFILIIPISLNGFGMGAVGLATKMVLIQFISVNILLLVITRFLKLSFKKFFGHQLIVIIILFILTKISIFISSLISNQVVVNFFVSGVIYSIFIFVLIFLYPKIIFRTKLELSLFKKHFFSW